MLDVRQAPAELRAVVLSLRAATPELRREMNSRARQEMGPVWKAEVGQRLQTDLDRRVIGAGVRIKAGNPPAALAAQSRRRLRGGLVPAEEWAPVELGANRAKTATYRRTSPKGRTHSVTRHTARQLSARRRSGRVALPAIAELAPRLASLWAATIVRTVLDAAERK